jgi:uncharacterized circularly permuted ATP-grasp superfamily protein/uncharacterized alpha-E superfamily protein
MTAELPPTPPPPDLCRGYAGMSGVYDEMCAPDGTLRSVWQRPMALLGALGTEGLPERRGEIRRLLRDNGVTYNVYGDPDGEARTWELDPLPLLVAEADWRRLEAGLEQRAVLLGRLLEDLYGPRECLTRGLIPAELVLGDPRFLRPCVDAPLPAPRALPLYAADLVRGPDGGFRVLADRVESPSGAGYALENRIILSRVLPDLLREVSIARLAEYFRRLRDTLASLAPRATEDPRIVLLSPGPHNETYFEHAYLANYLGYTLVEGGDLAVRDEQVALLTVDGLGPVDVVLRRVDGAFCDPLELRPGSFLGVPGLLQAVRDRRVAVANPLGAAVLENPALEAYLPALCRHWLGEDLALPGMDAWWCGTPAGLSHVLAHLDDLVIKPVARQPGERSVFPADLDAGAREALVAAIRAEPRRYVGQARITPATVPAVGEAGLEPRHAVLRTFAVAADEGYAVMPGGLTRVAAAPDDPVVSSQRGGASKDTWVVTDTPQPWRSLLPGVPAGLAARPRAATLPSRVGDNLFWLGRYLERAEGLVRLLRVVLGHLNERFEPQEDAGPAPLTLLLEALGKQAVGRSDLLGTQEGADPQPGLIALIGDPQRPGSLVQTLGALLGAARTAQDHLSVDAWRVVNAVQERQRALGRVTHTSVGWAGGLGRAADELDRVVSSLVAFAGLVNDNMTRCVGWRLLEIGRRLERALHTTGLLRATLVPALPERAGGVVLESVLSASDGLITYRRRYRATDDLASALDLVLLDPENPRSVQFQLDALERHCQDLPGGDRSARQRPESRVLTRAACDLRLADPLALAALDPDGERRTALDDLLAGLIATLPAFSDAITAAFFRHSEQLQPLEPEA